jgi:PKD repeat protein
VIFVPNQLTPVADFILVDPVVLVGSSVQFQDVSLNAPTAWSWFFPGGTPSVSNLQNPSVIYNANGFYSVTLIVSNAFGSDSITFTNYIEAMNHVYMCSGTSVVTYESGIVFDSGGPLNDYQNNEYCSLIIDIPCAISITLTFLSINLSSQFGWGDYIVVYDGISTNDPTLLYTFGQSLPLPVTSTGGAILIQFRSDSWDVAPGFEIEWTSTLSGLLPLTAAFSISDFVPPLGTLVQFTDNSNNDPFEWLWDFGDGNFST